MFKNLVCLKKNKFSIVTICYIIYLFNLHVVCFVPTLQYSVAAS